MNAQSNNASSYFNLHFTAIGYLNRVRWVETKRGNRKADPFLSCAVNALHGSADDPNYTYFDLKVSGKEAVEIISNLAADLEAQRKVIVVFRGGDIYPHLYQRQVRDQQGNKLNRTEPAALIKGRMLVVYSVKVDGVEVYRRPPTEDADVEAAAGAEATVQQGAESEEVGMPAESFEDRVQTQAPAMVQQRRHQPAPQHRGPQQGAPRQAAPQRMRQPAHA